MIEKFQFNPSVDPEDRGGVMRLQHYFRNESLEFRERVDRKERES
jgi:hypothetical protein